MPVTATLRLWGEPDGSQFGWVMGNERFAELFLRPGEYRIIRDGHRIRITDIDGTPRLVDDGDRAVVMTGGDPLDATEHLSVTMSATWLRSPGRLLRELDQLFPSGPVEDVVHDGHDCLRIPGLPARHLEASPATPRITVDAGTGVLLAVDNGDGGGELVDASSPDAVPADTFIWEGDRFGTPRRPDPWRPTGVVEEPQEEPVAEPVAPAWSERTLSADEVRRSGEQVDEAAGPVELPGYGRAWRHPDGGFIVLDESEDDERRVLVYRPGYVADGAGTGDVRWVEEVTSREPMFVYVVAGRIFSMCDGTLTLRDADLEVVRRYREPASRFWLSVVGPWFGAFEYRPMTDEDEWWEEDNAPGTYRLFDPESDGAELDVVLEVPVASSEVTARWVDGELWLSEGGGARVFRASDSPLSRSAGRPDRL
ncbi:hypothetical protein [Corynebacterium nuruki]|uniref:hypothetical protein n=1 Tax=Corynebacterium nuruki TaxID=1032851 RepID=UPI0039BF8BD1